MKPGEFFEAVKMIKNSYNCPACGSDYSHASAKLLGDMVDQTLFQMTCPTCSKPVLICLSNSRVVSDEPARPKISNLEVISVSEVVELYIWLSKAKSFTLKGRPKEKEGRMDKIVLEAKEREITRKNLKDLRLSGRVPGVVYGHGKKIQHIDADQIELRKVYAKAGKNKIIALKVDEGRAKNVLVYGVQIDPIKGELKHFDLYILKMDEPIRTEVPLHFTGESLAVYQQEGSLLKNMESVEVEALPANLPESFVVDISVLDDFDKSITLADLEIPEGVKLISEDLSAVIAKVEAPRSDEELEELESEVTEELPEGVAEEAPEVIADNHEEDRDRLTMK